MLAMQLGPSTKSLWVTNFSYFQKTPGILQLLEMILDLTCIILIAHYCRPSYNGNDGGFLGRTEETCFFVVTCCGLVETTLIVLTNSLSSPSSALISRTVHGMLSMCFLFACHAFASLYLLHNLIANNSGSPFKEHGFTGKVVASVLGFLGSILYMLSFVSALKVGKLADPY